LINLFALQFERTVGMFDRYPDGGGFLPTGHPIFGVPLAQLTLVGAVYLLVRSLRDVRLAVLSIWFWLGLSGVALTVETPDYLRSVGMLPSLCFVLAIPLLDLIDRIPPLRLPQRQVMAGAVPAVVALLLITPEVAGYFTTFRNLPNGWGPETREGQVIAALGASGPVYSLEANEHMVSSGWVRLLAPHTERGRMPNPGRELPVVTPAGPPVTQGEFRPDFFPATSQGFSIVFSPDPNQRPYFQLLQQLYPQAELADAGDQRHAIKVSPQLLADTQGAMLVDGSGALHPVDLFGQIPSDVSLPANLTWRAGVRLGRDETFRFVAAAPARAQLRIDGVPVADQVASISADVQATPGLHFVELVAEIAAGGDRQIVLGVGTPNTTPIPLMPAQTYRLMDAPWGLLAHLSRAYVQGQPSAFLDATVAMAFFDPEVGFVIAPNTMVWSGSLVAPRSGLYRMAFSSEDTMHLQVDGQPVDVVSVKPDDWQTVGTGSTVQLSQGAHRVQVTLDISHGGRELARWNWVPPQANGALETTSDWSVVPPQVLRPDPGAVSVGAR
jgi:hypothetical protein